ncbi:hypothetical protein J2741_000622 [Methanolinea mesophila]|uniref:hypothetical protein n=1 Tax=Methanolinea mesophila TaxID=547055 RepID=UPI001AE553E3|nr:hypothetical protein [Methanolinea mesophila]MBP1928075.1 hypothetical protein [Methanolinea mesophila]
MISRWRLGVTVVAGLAFVASGVAVSWNNQAFLLIAGLLVLYLAVLLASVRKDLGGVYPVCAGQPPVILLAAISPIFSLAGELLVIGLGVGIELRAWSAREGYLLLGSLVAAGIAGMVLMIPVHAGLLPLLVLVLAGAGTGLLLLNEQRINLVFRGKHEG